MPNQRSTHEGKKEIIGQFNTAYNNFTLECDKMGEHWEHSLEKGKFLYIKEDHDGKPYEAIHDFEALTPYQRRVIYLSQLMAAQVLSEGYAIAFGMDSLHFDSIDLENQHNEKDTGQD